MFVERIFGHPKTGPAFVLNIYELVVEAGEGGPSGLWSWNLKTVH
jgi:hypothetical protein